MTVRVKLETTDTGAGSPVAVTTATGFQALTDSRFSDANNGNVEYVILDGNGTDWEYGLGYQSGSNFYRVSVFESTNTDAAINLTIGTHTILFPAGGLGGRFASARFAGTYAAGAGGFGNISWTGFNESVDNVYDLPGLTAPTLPSTAPLSTVDYYRGYKINLLVTQDTATASNFVQFYGINNNIYSTAGFSGILPTDNTSFYASCNSPMLSMVPPIGTSPSYGGDPGDWVFTIYNPGAARTITAYLTVDFYL